MRNRIPATVFSTVVTRSADDVSRLVDEVRRLSDRIVIGEMVPRFAAAMDAHDEATLVRLFVSDVVVEHASGAFRGREELITGLRATGFKHVATHHLIATHRVEIDGDRASAVAYFHAVHLDDSERPEVHSDHGGWYLARFARDGEAWRFTYLKQVSIWQAEQMARKRALTPAVLEELRTWR
jgi:ketosteroid isomerase-like protein